MADTKVSLLVAKTTPVAADLVSIVDVEDTTMAASGSNKKVTFANFEASLTLANQAGNVPAAKQTTMVGDSGSGGVKGAVPAPATGDATKFLKGDGTWGAISGGGDALIGSPLSQFAPTTSAQLAGVLSDETGTGVAVFGTSPHITAPTGIVKADVGLGNVRNVNREYDAIVAASGGDYTTVGAAISDGKVNICVENGTYIESAWAPLAATNITGATRDGAIIDFGGTGYIAALDNLIVHNITITDWEHTSGGIRVVSTASDCQFQNVRFESVSSHAAQAIRLGGFRRIVVTGCLFNNATATAASYALHDNTDFFTGIISNNVFQGNFMSAIRVAQGSLFRFNGNYCQSTFSGGTLVGWAEIVFTGLLHDCSITNNYFGTSASNQCGVNLNTCQAVLVIGNNIAVNASTGIGVNIVSAAGNIVADNYFIGAHIGVKVDSGSIDNIIGVNGNGAGTSGAGAATIVSDAGTGTSFTPNVAGGTNGQVLTKDSTQPYGSKWASAGGGPATDLASATTTVNVSAATAPTNGQVLTATGGTSATWQSPSGGGGVVGTQAFSAYRSTSTNYGTSSDQLISFNTKAFDIGTNYSTSTDIYTIPVTGGYSFTSSLYLNGSPGANSMQIAICLNGAEYKVSSYNQPPVAFDQLAITAIGSFTAGDAITVHVLSSGGINIGSGQAGAWFEGYRLW